MTLTLYCFDTSPLINGNRRYWPPDIFAGVWTRIADLVEEGRIIAPLEVREEINRRDQGFLVDWVREHRTIFQEYDGDVQAALRKLIEVEPRLINSESQHNMADPFVVALALARGATVVTEETRAGPGSQKPKIPNCCELLDVPHLNLIGLMRAEGWGF